MKRTIVLSAIFMMVVMLLLPQGVSAQGPRLKNPSNNMTLEVSRGGDQMIIEPGKEKMIPFLPTGGETKVMLRYFIGNRVYAAFPHSFTIVEGQVYTLPQQEAERRPAGSDMKRQDRDLNKPAVSQPSSTSQSSTAGPSPKIPEVTGTAVIRPFSLVLTNRSKSSILVFEGDFYGAALAAGKSTESSTTTPGMISMKILYDADPPEKSTGKNMWQVPITGLVTQGQDTFYITDDHLVNIQRNARKVVFYNPTGYKMVNDNPNYDIDPIAPGRYSKPIKMNSGFNNMSFSYINENGVKVRAVFETVVTTRGTPVIKLSLNPLGGGYGVIK